MDKKLGENIRLRRKQKRLTQEELGKMLNYSKSTVSNWEKGIEPSSSQLNALANALGVSVDYLLGREKKERYKSSPNYTRSHSYSVKYHRLQPNRYDYKHYILILNIIFTLVIAYYPNDIVLGIVFLGWPLFALMKIYDLIYYHKKQQETITYSPGQEVIYEIKKSSDTKINKLRRRAQWLILAHTLKFIFTVIFVVGISYTILTDLYGGGLEVALPLFLLLFFMFVVFFLLEETKINRSIDKSIPINDVPDRFGIWRYKILIGIDIFILILFLLVLSIEKSLLDFPSIDFLFIPIFHIFNILWSYKMVNIYKNIFLHYEVAVRKKRTNS